VYADDAMTELSGSDITAENILQYGIYTFIKGVVIRILKKYEELAGEDGEEEEVGR